jgi:hypothetical protein
MKWLIGGIYVVSLIGFCVWWSRKRFRYEGTKGENWSAIRARLEENRRLAQQREADPTADRMGTHW